jgi:hypothetical protein
MRYAAFSRDRFRRALCLGLSIADGLGQHLAQLDFSLWRFAREGFCPCCHRQHMGMPQGELNPRLSRQGSNADLDGGFEFTPHSSCPSWVKRRNTRSEQMWSALHPKADSTRTSGHVRNMPLQKNHVDWNCRGSSSGRAFGGGLVICRQKLSASEH